jgi:citronellol/citronellal dehydrogenase
MDISGRVAIVTGASRGLGKAMAFALAEQGASVVVASRTEEPGGRLPGTIRETADQIVERGGKAIPIRADMAVAEDVDALIERTLSELGGIDIVIHNAAAVVMGRVVETPMRRWDLVWNVNMRATGALITGAYPSMKEHGAGSIVIVTQLAPSSAPGRGFNPVYRLAKNASAELVQIAAGEVKDENIAVNGLWPASPRDTIGGRTARGGGPRGLHASIFGDAVVELIGRSPSEATGQLLTDEEVLRQAGVTDLSKYEPTTENSEF